MRSSGNVSESHSLELHCCVNMRNCDIFFDVISGALNDLGQIIYRIYFKYYRHYIDGAGDITLVYMKNSHDFLKAFEAW